MSTTDTTTKTPAKRGTTKATAKRGPKGMSEDHKAALAQGRAEGRAVRDYLTALSENKPKRGRPRTVETVDARLAVIADTIADADPVTRLTLTQEQLDLEAERVTLGVPFDIAALEEGFVAVAAGYAARKGISYTAFRAVGVPASTLKAAGIPRSA